jgi:hypothetical protein
MVLRAGFKKKLRLYVELKIYDKNRRKITGPQCVKFFLKLFPYFSVVKFFCVEFLPCYSLAGCFVSRKFQSELGHY